MCIRDRRRPFQNLPFRPDPDLGTNRQQRQWRHTDLAGNFFQQMAANVLAKNPSSPASAREHRSPGQARGRKIYRPVGQHRGLLRHHNRPAGGEAVWIQQWSWKACKHLCENQEHIRWPPSQGDVLLTEPCHTIRPEFRMEGVQQQRLVQRYDRRL